MSLFEQKGVVFKEIHAPGGSTARAEAQKRSGGKTSVPQIFINDTLIGGCDDMMALEHAGRLDALLER